MLVGDEGSMLAQDGPTLVDRVVDVPSLVTRRRDMPRGAAAQADRSPARSDRQQDR